MSWLAKLKGGLFKTSNNISKGISQVFTHKKLDEQALHDLEEALILSDMGTEVASDLIKAIAHEKFEKDISEGEVRSILAKKIAAQLQPIAKQLAILPLKPMVLLVCGVNGNGKTTTIGKLAAKYKSQGKKVMLAACDTFRAAAVEQLEIWANRTGCTLVKGESNADPASVAFKALEKAKAEGVDMLMIDTAGRLHNKTDLMDELAKIIRVIKKLDESAPHETLLVLDATTGQNALAQVETFKNLVQISGLIITKLDGTAKGGILLAIAKKYALPVYAIGVGEGIEDLNSFNPEDFAKALISS
jgi:fused signal recognition particle receptor